MLIVTSDMTKCLKLTQKLRRTKSGNVRRCSLALLWIDSYFQYCPHFHSRTMTHHNAIESSLHQTHRSYIESMSLLVITPTKPWFAYSIYKPLHTLLLHKLLLSFSLFFLVFFLSQGDSSLQVKFTWHPISWFGVLVFKILSKFKSCFTMASSYELNHSGCKFGLNTCDGV